jgi:hypothetical protein
MISLDGELYNSRAISVSELLAGDLPHLSSTRRRASSALNLLYLLTTKLRTKVAAVWATALTWQVGDCPSN